MLGGSDKDGKFGFSSTSSQGSFRFKVGFLILLLLFLAAIFLFVVLIARIYIKNLKIVKRQEALETGLDFHSFFSK